MDNDDTHLDEAEFRQLNGDIGRQVPTGFILVPGKIELDGDTLVWELPGPAKHVRPDHGMLEGFMRLASAPPNKFLSYVHKWGVLALDDRGCPCKRATSGREPLDRRRYFARRARNLLQSAAHAKLGKIAPDQYWQDFVSDEALMSYLPSFRWTLVLVSKMVQSQEEQKKEDSRTVETRQTEGALAI